MDWLNYHHLFYFWVVAREGSIASACEQLQRAQPTISGELRDLEAALGHKLFHRAGRGLVLTETGQLVFSYADKIFKLGQELTNAVKGRDPSRPQRLLVGVTDELPPLLAYHLLAPVRQSAEGMHLVCWEGKPARLQADLATHALDVVLTDTPASPFLKIRAVSHLLGECGLSFFATKQLASRYALGFPRSLQQAPLLLPIEDSAARRALEQWLRRQHLRPAVQGEVESPALLKIFGQTGAGIFALPTVIEAEVCQQYQVEVIGRAEGACMRFYALTTERRLTHPAVAALVEAARKQLFGGGRVSGDR